MKQQKQSAPTNLSPKPMIFLVLGVSLVTLYFDLKSVDPINTPKLILLLIISSLATGRLVKTIKSTRIKHSKNWYLLILLVSFFLGSSLISTLLSDSLFTSFIGDTQRRNGFLSYLALSIVALSASKFIDFKNVNYLFKISVLTGSIFSFYGLMQISGRDFVSWSNPYNAVIGTVGNPNFASALMAILTTLSLATLFMKWMPLAFKLTALICVIMSIIAIFASNSRQGLVSLSLAILFFASGYLYLNRRRIGLLVIAFSIAVSAFAIAGMLQIGPLTSLLYKASVSVRGYYWSAAIEMFKSNPITGIGFDHYGYYFKEFRSVEYPLRYGFDLSSTNAHNTFLQMFATGGFFVGFSYLLIVLTTLILGLKLVRDSYLEEQILSLGVVSAWLAFQAQSVISIDNIGISVWGWLLTGAIFGLASKKETDKKDIQIINARSLNQKQVSVMPFFITTLFLIPTVVLSTFLTRVESNTMAARNLYENLAQQSDKSTQFSRQLLSLLESHTNYVLNNPLSDPNYKLRSAVYLFDFNEKNKGLQILIDMAEQYPQNLYILEPVAEFSAQLGENITALNVRNKIVKLDPWNAKNYLKLMVLYKAVGDIPNAEKMKDKILSFAPSTLEAKIALEEFAK